MNASWALAAPVCFLLASPAKPKGTGECSLSPGDCPLTGDRLKHWVAKHKLPWSEEGHLWPRFEWLVCRDRKPTGGEHVL